MRYSNALSLCLRAEEEEVGEERGARAGTAPLAFLGVKPERGDRDPSLKDGLRVAAAPAWIAEDGGWRE